jgi:hypothetical protein
MEISDRVQANPLNSVARINKTFHKKGFSFCPHGILFSLCGSRDSQKARDYLPKQQTLFGSYNEDSVLTVRQELNIYIKCILTL